MTFLPKGSFDFYTEFKDSDVLYNKRLSYKLLGNFKFSAINYYINRTPDNKPNYLPPIGVLNYDDKTVRWNDELFYSGKLRASFSYKVPGIDLSISPSMEIEYKRILDQKDAENLPIDKIMPKMGLDLSFPIKSINAFIKPSFNINYTLTLGNESLAISEDDLLEAESGEEFEENLDEIFYGNASDSLVPDIKLGFSFLIPVFNARIDPFIKIVYQKITNYNFMRGDILNGKKGYISPIDNTHNLDSHNDTGLFP